MLPVLLLQYLKQETADLHREAERHVRILDADATPATYVRYLQRMLGFHAAIERVFAADAALARTGYDAAARQKQPMLVADLAALDAEPDASRATLPALDNLSRAIGAAYVVEGSTLGGAFILARMRKGPLASLVGRATAFLEGYAGETGARWKQFRAIADALPASEAPVASDAARETFAALIAWLDEPAREAPHPFRSFA